MNHYQILLGRAIPQSIQIVSHKEFEIFLKNQNYLESWTITHCQGGWKDTETNEIVFEDTFKLEYISEIECDQIIKDFAIFYKKEFKQQEVWIVKNYNLLIKL